MTIFKLQHFPNVCRNCLKYCPTEQLSPLSSSPSGCLGLTVAECLSELTTTAIPSGYSKLIPKAICSQCLVELKKFMAYRKRQSFLSEFIVALAKVRQGNGNAMIALFEFDSKYVQSIFRELNLCSKQDFQVEDLLKEYTTVVRDPSMIDAEIESFNFQTEKRASMAPMEFVEVSTKKPKVFITLPKKNMVPITPQKSPNILRHKVEVLEEYLYEKSDNDDHADDDDDHQYVVKEEPKKRKLSPNVPKVPVNKGLRKCLKCNFQTSFALIFDHHMKSNHQSVKPSIDTSSGERGPEIFCPICGLVFRESMHLKKHLDTHSSETRHTCGICRQSFTTKQQMRRHFDEKHPIKKFQCDRCDKMYPSKQKVEQHVAKQHKGFHTDVYSILDQDETFRIVLRAELDNGLIPTREKLCLMTRILCNAYFSEAMFTYQKYPTFEQKHLLSCAILEAFPQLKGLRPHPDAPDEAAFFWKNGGKGIGKAHTGMVECRVGNMRKEIPGNARKFRRSVNAAKQGALDNSADQLELGPALKVLDQEDDNNQIEYQVENIEEYQNEDDEEPEMII